MGSWFPFTIGVEVPLTWAKPFSTGFVGVVAGVTIVYTSPVTGFLSTKKKPLRISELEK